MSSWPGAAGISPGGLYRLVEALVALCGELGVDLRLGAPVARGAGRRAGRRARATGLRLAGGAQVPADAVVVNADPLYATRCAVRRRAGRRGAGRRARPRRRRPVLLRLRAAAGHRLRAGRSWPTTTSSSAPTIPAEFRAIFDERRPAPDPTIYVSYTSAQRPDPGPARRRQPVRAGQRAAGADARRRLGRLGGAVSRAHPGPAGGARGCAGLRRHIVYRQVITPADFRAPLQRLRRRALRLRLAQHRRPRSRARPTARPACAGLYLRRRQRAPRRRRAAGAARRAAGGAAGAGGCRVADPIIKANKNPLGAGLVARLLIDRRAMRAQFHAVWLHVDAGRPGACGARRPPAAAPGDLRQPPSPGGTAT